MTQEPLAKKIGGLRKLASALRVRVADLVE